MGLVLRCGGDGVCGRRHCSICSTKLPMASSVQIPMKLASSRSQNPDRTVPSSSSPSMVRLLRAKIQEACRAEKPGVRNPAQAQSAATFRRTLDIRGGHPAEIVSTGACLRGYEASHRNLARCDQRLSGIAPRGQAGWRREDFHAGVEVGQRPAAEGAAVLCGSARFCTCHRNVTA